MNIHLSQSIPAIVETKNIISTVENFNSSQDSKPMIGFKLDAMTSAYLITLGTIKVHKWLFEDICNRLDKERVKHKINHIKEVLSWKSDLTSIFNQLIQSNTELQQLENELQSSNSKLNDLQSEYANAKGKQIATLYKQVEKQRKEVQSLSQRKNAILETYQSTMLEEMLYTGHNLFSILLPDDFEYEIQNNASPDGKPVVIVRGVLISGTLDKKAMGSSSGSLIHHLSKDYNNQRAIRFVSEFSRMMNGWLYQQGFTVGIYDCMAHNTEVIEEEINKNLLKAKASIQSENDPELREMNIKIALNDTASIARKIASEALKPDNKIKKIVKSGSKGNDFNITQITGLVGQQNVSGNRIEKQFGGRTLPHFEFEIDDIRTEFMSRGFVFSSYFKGMNPMETFFAAAGGREGLIDTAVKSVTGDTTIIVLQNGNILQTTIGEWVDGQLDNPIITDKIQHFDEMNMEYLEIEEKKTYIPTCDSKGKTSWGEVVAITRHDPGNELFEIKTQSGREVIVTASKSLVIWDEKKEEFLPTLMKDVKVGDYVPVTMELCEPPVVKTYVDMSTYLPKTEYVYGTDFNMAVEAMDSVMESELSDGAKNYLKSQGKETNERTAIPKGWWQKNNGSTFTVPYPSKARLQRAIVRSNVADIKFGYIYPFGGARHDHLIPDKFQLNYENGIFIGLFLADGNVEINKKAEVRVTKNNKKIQEFVTKWFDKHKIHYFIEKKVVEKTETKPGGTSTTIRGNCSVLAQFLLKFVGHTSYDKFVPNEAFTAPKEFIRGLVSGFFSGDGSVEKEGKGITACSTSKKLTDGILYCLNRLGIFCKIRKSQQKSNNIGTENISPIYTIDIRSQWALLFKQQIKLIEDDKQARLDALDPTESHRNYPFINNVVYDSIVEINKVGVEKYPKVYDLTIPSTFNFSTSSGLICRDTADTGYLQRRMEKILEDLTASYIGTVNDASHNIVQFNYGEDNFDASKCILVGSKGGKQIFSFVDLKHIVTKYNTNLEWKQRKTGVVNKKRKFTQDEIHKIKEEIIRDTYKSFFHKHTTDAMIQNSFSTLEPTIYQVDVYPEVIQDIYKEISRQLKLAIVNPGESVGHIAASSIGEKNTQSTLNSVIGETNILILDKDKAIQTTIGELINSIGENQGFTTVKYEGQNDTQKEATAEIVDVSDLDWKIQSVDADGKVEWRQITKCIRHPLYTDVIKVKTESGREVTATTGLSFLIKDGQSGKIIPVKGSDLKLGDRIPIGYKSPSCILPEYSHLTYEDGLDTEKLEIIPDYIFNTPLPFVKGYIDSILNHTQKYKTDKEENADKFITLLTMVGLYATKQCIDGIYICKQVNVHVSSEEDVFMDAIVSIEKVDTSQIQYVYDFEVPSTGNFNLLNQMHVRDSFHASGQLKKNLTYGLVRLQELMNATHNPKTRSLTIYFNKNKVDITSLSIIRQIANMHLLSRTLSDFILSYKIEKNPELTKLEQNWYYIYKSLVANDDTSHCSYRLRLTLNTDLLFLTKRTLRQICKQLEMIIIKNVSFYVICSNDATGIIDIWIEDNISEPSTFFTAKGMEADLLLDNFINKHNKMTHLIKKIILPKLKKCHISGIEGITECYYDQTKQDEWFIQTRGGSLKCLLFHPLIDWYRSYTNDMWEIYDLFGVECAKKWLKDEFSQMLDVNHRHLDILVDKVTFNGSISSVNIYGLDRKIIGPLSKAVFERPLACLLTAAQKAELDRLTSIGACIATGKIGRFGTGMIDVILDNQSVVTNEYANKVYTTSQIEFSELAPLQEEDDEAITIEEQIDLNEEDIY